MKTEQEQLEQLDLFTDLIKLKPYFPDEYRDMLRRCVVETVKIYDGGYQDGDDWVDIYHIDNELWNPQRTIKLANYWLGSVEIHIDYGDIVFLDTDTDSARLILYRAIPVINCDGTPMSDEDKKEIIFAVTDITSEHTVRQNLNI